MFFGSCSVQKKVIEQDKIPLIGDSALKAAHIGFAFYDVAARKYILEYQSEKYFIPASNIKIPTCYLAMKLLGDSLAGLKFARLGASKSKDYWIQPTGDPTFLHPDFPNQPVLNFLKRDSSIKYHLVSADQWKDKSLEPGWSWDDFDQSYMPERSQFPVYGNVIRFSNSGNGIRMTPLLNLISDSTNATTIKYDSTSLKYVYSRLRDKNIFVWKDSKEALPETQEVPFICSLPFTVALLKDTIRVLELDIAGNTSLLSPRTMFSQPTDSMLRLMMHRSDNFFAEQTLLMVSNSVLGYMNGRSAIDSLLNTVLKELPQKPKWVDGSGMSRYNLFSPKDFVVILEKMSKEFSWNRISTIFPGGDEGTLKNYYVAEKGYIFAKTGTLADVVALSGFLKTKKNKLIVFSVLINNHGSSSTLVRRAIEKMIKDVRDKN